jgi:hypothetical protein
MIGALAAAHDAAVQMIDTSIVRVHQHGACITRNRKQSMGWSRGGLTSKIHALVDTHGRAQSPMQRVRKVTSRAFAVDAFEFLTLIYRTKLRAAVVATGRLRLSPF